MYGLIQVSSHVNQAQFLGFPSSTGAILRQALPSGGKVTAVASDYIPSGVRPAEKCHLLVISTQTMGFTH